MNHLEKLAVDSQIAVYVMASPDAQEIEILPLKPRTASDAERESLAARWPGRDLRPIGVIGRLADGGVNMALRVPFDHIQLASLLQAFAAYCESEMEPEYDWYTQQYRLAPRNS
jgi:hypothetical protein